MARTTRRTLLAAAGTAALLPALPARAGREGQLVHHVLFWLKRPDSQEDRDQLIEGIRSLAAIETVRGVHVGVPADTLARDVVDGSWSVSEILYFDDAAGQDAYQVDPLHTAFVEGHSHLWERVVVYDAVPA